MGSTQDIDILDIAEGSNPTITKDELRELLTKNQDKIKKTQPSLQNTVIEVKKLNKKLGEI